jgi:hypothetical protein
MPVILTVERKEFPPTRQATILTRSSALSLFKKVSVLGNWYSFILAGNLQRPIQEGVL